MRELNRAEPNLPAHAYQSFSIKAPVSTHWRSASCAEVSCPKHLNGWRVRVEGLPPELLHAARKSGRRYVEQPVAEGETWLVFEAGQPCFQAATHRVRVQRPELFLVRGGDWRQSYGAARRHTRPELWVEEFQENQQRLVDAKRQG